MPYFQREWTVDIAIFARPDIYLERRRLQGAYETQQPSS